MLRILGSLMQAFEDEDFPPTIFTDFVFDRAQQIPPKDKLESEYALSVIHFYS